MSVLGSLTRRAAGMESRTADLSATLIALRQHAPTFAGRFVDDDQALRLGAVWACVQLKANLISALPIDAYKLDNGLSSKIANQPSLVTSPSATVRRSAWLYQLSVSLDLRGNAYGLIFARDSRGYPTQIELFHPDDVQVRLVGKPGVPVYRFCNQIVPNEDVFHVAENLVPGSPVGLAPIEYARQVIGLGLGAEEFAARFFGDGGIPAAVLESDQKIDQTDAETIKGRVNQAQQGSREMMVLGLGVKYRPIQVNPEESQFLATIKATRSDIAPMFNLPPEFIGGDSGSSMTYSNIESRFLNLLTIALHPRLVRVEEALSEQLPRPQFTKFDPDELLRTDVKTQHDVVVNDYRAGILNGDEARAKFNRPPIPDGKGEQFLWPPFAVKPDVQTDDTSIDPEPAVPNTPDQVLP